MSLKSCFPSAKLILWRAIYKTIQNIHCIYWGKLPPWNKRHCNDVYKYYHRMQLWGWLSFISWSTSYRNKDGPEMVVIGGGNALFLNRMNVISRVYKKHTCLVISLLRPVKRLVVVSLYSCFVRHVLISCRTHFRLTVYGSTTEI